MKFSLLILFFYFLFSSCTVEKRHYTGGFYVDWFCTKINSHSSPAISNPEIHRVIAQKVSIISKPRALESSVSFGLAKKKAFKKEYLHKLVNTSAPVISDTNDNARKERYYKRKFGLEEIPVLNRWALASFICAILPLIITPPSILVFILMALLAIVFSIIALIQFDKYPYKYYGKIFAIIGLLLGSLTILLLFLLLG